MLTRGANSAPVPSAVVVFVCIVAAGISPLIEACFHYTGSNVNPCLAKPCPFGAQCVAAFDGRSAECVCPAKCRSYGDSRHSRPICGSDGHDYANLCELNRHACSAMQTLFVRYNGSCDPCYGVKCPESQICQIDDNRNPICKCNAACGKEFEPCCGSDGKTYVNECILRVEACKTRKSLRILHQGPCPEANSCKTLKCSAYQECEVNRYGIAVCQCPSTCSKVLKPVCGTDGETYDSECELTRQACVNHHNVSVRYHGVCDPQSFCHQNHGVCKFGSKCLSSTTNYTCICGQCGEEYAPVCGSNGITYTNLCKFRRDMCEKQMSNVTVRQGTCVGCEQVNCMFYSYCESSSDKPGEGHCSCPSTCQKSHEPVCGSDLVTYANECALRLSSCEQRKYVVVIKQGACISCQDVHCDYGARCENGLCVCPRKCPVYIDPVCGSNNVTYDNECKLMTASCESTTQISIRSKGVCDETGLIKANQVGPLCLVNTCKYEGICVMDQRLRSICLCSFNCSNVDDESQQICGNDGRIYPSECVFREEMCNRQQEIKPIESIYCDKYRNIPCKGEPPLVNEITQVEYNCTYENCPKQSYCHKIFNFAKCCREIDPEEDCFDTTYGCCQDEKTVALGPNYNGCPSTCQCNRLGSYLLRCDPTTKQCYCKPGVGGVRCDRCEAGFWGLHKISEGNAGCIPCKCNRIGSSRDDCEQMSGRCVCKTGFKGMKCDICSDGSPVEYGHCVRAENASCSHTSQCKFGAVCVHSVCQCELDCSTSAPAPVCASDGNTFQNECHLRLWSCKLQKSLTVAHFDKCQATTLRDSATTSPVRRSTEYQNLNKSTRHVVIEDGLFVGTAPTMPTLYWEAESRNWPFFGGSAFIEMTTLQAYSKMSIRIEMIPFEPDGIVLFNAQSSNGDGDYIALLLRNQFIEYRFNLGSGSVVLKSSKQVILGKSVNIDIKRHLSEGFLSVDESENITGKSEGPHKLLDLGQSLFLGGVPSLELKRVADVLGTKRNFTGCIRMLTINEEAVPLEPSSNNEILNYIQIEPCSRQKCSSTFCRNEGTCVHNDQQYSCLCSDTFSGLRCQHSQTCNGEECEKANPDEILDFWNDSYIELPTLQGVNQAFTLEIWLMLRSLNGLVLYNGQSKGDFIELALVDGALHYNFNLGGQSNTSGVVNIKSESKLTLGEWHRVKITRKSKEGSLQVNAEPIIKETAKGNLNELNLDEPLYLGGLGERKFRSNQTRNAFDGVIQKIALNAQLWQNVLQRSSKVVNIRLYQGGPCGSENPCKNQGKCQAWLNDFICKCSKGFHGSRCEQDGGLLPTMHGDFAQIPFNTSTFPFFSRQQNQFELSLSTKTENGLLLWTSKSDKVVSDYLAILMVDGFLEFSFDLGRQLQYLSLRSAVRVDDGAVHNIVVTRNKQIAVMQVDDKFLSSIASEKGATDLNTDGSLWIGGHLHLPPTLPTAYYTPFRGCLHSLRLEGVVVDLKDTVTSTTKCQTQ